MTTPTDREAQIAAAVALAIRDVAELPDRESPEEWPEAMLVTGSELETILTNRLRDCPPAPDGKALRELRDRMRSTAASLPNREHTQEAEFDRGYCEACDNWAAEIDRLLTAAPVADAEVAPVREGALQGTPTRMTDADRREVDALKKRAFDEASAIVEPTPAEWCDQIMDVVARSRTRTGLSEPIRLDMDEIVCDRSELERAAKWLRTALADMLAIAQQVGIVYEADYCAPVAGPTPAILRAITKMQRDAGDADQLRSAGLSLRAENARLQTDLTAARAERDAALRDVQLGTSESEVVRLALAQRDAARADQAAMAREQLTAVLGEVVANYETRWDRDIEIRWCPQRWLRTYITTRLAALPQPKPAAEPVPASIAAPQRGDWPEDAVYENGSYQGLCSVCGGWFTGHKRRVVCKTCYDVVLDAPQRQQPAGDRPDMTARVLRGPVSEAAVFDEAEQQTLTAAIPPLPSDEGRVRETVERSKAELAFGHFIEMNPAEGYLNPLYAAVYHLCRRALAGKEKP